MACGPLHFMSKWRGSYFFAWRIPGDDEMQNVLNADKHSSALLLISKKEKAMRKNVFEKSTTFILLIAFAVVLLFSLSEVWTVRDFNRKIEGIYRNSINYSSNYWADQFYVANKELKSMIDKDMNTDFNRIAQADLEDSVEDEMWALQNSLTNMSVINDTQIIYFAYFPKRDLMLTSVTYIDYFRERETEELKEYLQTITGGNTASWNEIRLGQAYYFLHTYKKNGAYSGCYISCENVLADIMPEDQESNAYILNMDGSVFYAGTKNKVMTGDLFTYARPIRMINKKICIEIPYTGFADSASYVRIVITIAVIASVLLFLLAVLYQRVTVFDPLMKLKYAMEQFSRGRDVVLEDEHEKNEIAVLYQTFNRMREQIMNLKIDVYDASIAREKLYNQFLRVQIQPHFYTNMLNLIHTLADAGECETIQELAKYMADYFRYVLSLNRDFVPLAKELQCVRQYANVQKIRYQDNFSLEIECSADAEKELIPPFLIQTFVENSIKHNIMIVEDLRVGLQVIDCGVSLEIIIWDNGVGMSDVLIEKLEKGEDIEEDGQHIGIFNVIHRLAALYLGKAEIKMMREEIGTRTVIRIPKTEKKEAAEDGNSDC